MAEPVMSPALRDAITALVRACPAVASDARRELHVALSVAYADGMKGAEESAVEVSSKVTGEILTRALNALHSAGLLTATVEQVTAVLESVEQDLVTKLASKIASDALEEMRRG